MWSEVESLARVALSDEVIPGLGLCVHDGHRVLWEFAEGHAELRPNPRQVGLDTVWDLASLTKVLVTVPVTMSLIESGVLTLDSSISDVLPDAPAGVTVTHCLQHSTGWPAWRSFVSELDIAPEAWGSKQARRQVCEAICRTPLLAEPGRVHRYSDLGMMALGFALEEWGGASLDVLASAVFGEASADGLSWGAERAAATEDCPVRGRVLDGEVHDLNAALLGGVAAHAGLFGRTSAVAERAALFLRALRGEGPWSEELTREFMERAGPGSHRLGWDSPSGPTSAAGPDWPRNGVGHLAFTGCSIWLAPSESWVVVMCSNRLHPIIEGGAVPGAAPGPRTKAFKRLRPAIHSAIATVLGRRSTLGEVYRST